MDWSRRRVRESASATVAPTSGFYFEAGPSFVSEEDGRFGQFVSGKRWFPQVSTGIAFNLW